MSFPDYPLTRAFSTDPERQSGTRAVSSVSTRQCPGQSGLRDQAVTNTVADRVSALVVAIKVIAGPIGQIAAIVAAILGPRPLQLAACAFGLFTAFVILSTRLTTRGYAPDLEGWGAGVVIYGVGWGIALAVIL